MKSRYSRPYDKDIINASIYLKKHIGIDSKDNGKFICSLCKSDPKLFESLLIHLKSKTHTKHLPADSQTSKLHEEAIQKLTELGFRGSTREKSPVRSSSKKEREDFLASQQTASSIQDIQVKFRFEVAKFVLQNNLPISLTDKLITFAKNIANNFDSKDLNEVTGNRNHTASFAIAIGTALQSR